MVQLISGYICNFIEQNISLSKQEKTIITYCLRQILTRVVFFCSLLLFGILTGRLLHTLVYCITLAPLRSFGGGVHANNKTTCSFFSYGISFLTIFYIPLVSEHINDNVMFFMFFLFMIYPLIKAPIDCPNKRLNPSTKKKLRAKFLVFFGFLSLLTIIFYLCHCKSFLGMICACVIIFSISFYIGILINRKVSCYEI